MSLATQLCHSFTSTESSLAHRARVAKLIAPFKRVRVCVPFYELAAHRIPTLWTLYRSLLRDAPTEDIRWRITRIFRANRQLTSPAATKAELLKGYRWADIFAKAKQGDAHLQAVLQRYSSMIKAKRDKEEFKEILRRELAWQAKLRNRPILTGYFRSSVYNKTLPRLKPQPSHITGMICKRRKARDRRNALYADLNEAHVEILAEAEFEKNLFNQVRREGMGFSPEFFIHEQTWEIPIFTLQKELRRTFRRDMNRALTPASPELVEAVKRARRDKILNKRAEREREARGIMTRRAIRRRRQRPPAHILAEMSEKEKHLDKVARSSVTEVGYVGLVKRKLGWKLRNPEALKVEAGKPENRAWLGAMEEAVRKENERRRLAAERNTSA